MDRYLGIEPSTIIGSGSYGVVYKVQDRLTRETFALKQFVDESNNSYNRSSNTGVPYYIVREASVLKELRHENIVTLIDCVFDDPTGSLSLVFEYMDTDLHRYIHDAEGTLSPGVVRSLLKQCLRGIECCHGCGILHRDLKPANLLLSRAGTLKVADFGLARSCTPSPQRRLTHEVVTLWYRAPEILLGSRQYGFAADMWSVGLIFAEMITKSPLLRTRRLAEIEVLFKMFRLFGTPTDATWPEVTELPDWSEDFPKWRSRPIDILIRECLDERGLDLLYRMLTMDPSKRITAKSALAHAYFL